MGVVYSGRGLQWVGSALTTELTGFTTRALRLGSRLRLCRQTEEVESEEHCTHFTLYLTCGGEGGRGWREKGEGGGVEPLARLPVRPAAVTE